MVTPKAHGRARPQGGHDASREESATGGPPRFHSGFLEMLAEHAEDLRTAVKAELRDQEKAGTPVQEILICGHSLGGGYAQTLLGSRLLLGGEQNLGDNEGHDNDENGSEGRRGTEKRRASVATPSSLFAGLRWRTITFGAPAAFHTPAEHKELL